VASTLQLIDIDQMKTQINPLQVIISYLIHINSLISLIEGVVLTFHSLNERPEIYKYYEYFMLMEPDVHPIRANWLDQFVRECFGELHNYWMKGSMYVGPKFVDESTSAPWLYHINGNSIFHVADWEWRSFLGEVKRVMGVGNPYDVSIYEYRRNRFKRNQQIIHKFIYTPFILNYGVSGKNCSIPFFFLSNCFSFANRIFFE